MSVLYRVDLVDKRKIGKVVDIYFVLKNNNDSREEKKKKKKKKKKKEEGKKQKKKVSERIRQMEES
jgi:hypothetical protein